MRFLWRMVKLADGGGLKETSSHVPVWVLGAGMGRVREVAVEGVSQVEGDEDPDRTDCRIGLLRSSRKSLDDHQRCRQIVGKCTRL